MQMTEINTKQNIKYNFLLLFFVIILFFLAFEISLRIFSYPTYGFQKNVFSSDNLIGYKLSSNYSGIQSIFGRNFELKTNSVGLRDFREYTFNKSNGKFRILILGDSFSFGNGVNLNESYPEYLREKFENSNIEIINFGVPGYGMNNEYLSFIKEGQKYNPDLILIQFSPNDWGIHQILEENLTDLINPRYSLTANSQGFLVSSGKEGTLRSIHLFLLWNLKSYSFFYSKSRTVFSKIISAYWKKQDGIPPYFQEVNSSEYLENYRGYSYLVGKLKNNTSAKIILFSGPFTIDNIAPEEIKKVYSLTYSPNPEQTKESVKSIASKFKLGFIDIKSDNPNIFLPVDGHWNSIGNKFVAEELYSQLRPLIPKKFFLLPKT